MSELILGGLLAEKHGFDSVWVQDHFADVPPSGDKVDPWVLMTAVGVQTRKIMLGTGVTDVQRLHPAKMAHIVATLDELTKGRTNLGIGTGEAMNIRPYGFPWEDPNTRTSRLRESIAAMRALWNSSRENPLTMNGSFYQLKEAWLDQRTYEGRSPKIYIGALGSPRMLRLVGEIGDGYFPWFNTLETFKNRVEIIESAAKDARRHLKDIDLVVLLFAAITDDRHLEKRAIDAMKSEIAILNHRQLLKKMGYEVRVSGTTDYSYQHVLATYESAKKAATVSEGMPDEIATQFMLTGSSSDCIEKIAAFKKLGATHIVVRDVIGQYLFGSVEKTKGTFKALSNSVIPYFRLS